MDYGIALKQAVSHLWYRSKASDILFIVIVGNWYFLQSFIVSVRCRERDKE